MSAWYFLDYSLIDFFVGLARGERDIRILFDLFLCFVVLLEWAREARGAASAVSVFYLTYFCCCFLCCMARVIERCYL